MRRIATTPPATPPAIAATGVFDLWELEDPPVAEEPGLEVAEGALADESGAPEDEILKIEQEVEKLIFELAVVVGGIRGSGIPNVIGLYRPMLSRRMRTDERRTVTSRYAHEGTVVPGGISRGNLGWKVHECHSLENG